MWLRTRVRKGTTSAQSRPLLMTAWVSDRRAVPGATDTRWNTSSPSTQRYAIMPARHSGKRVYVMFILMAKSNA